MLGLSLSVLLLGAPAVTPTPPRETSSLQQQQRPIDRVWLRSPGLDEVALAGAVRARLADKEVLGAGADAGPGDGLAALCHVSLHADELRLEVILGDGRLYQRTIAAPAGERERAAARLIAATLAAIEDASATPDRSDAVFVPPVAEGAEEVVVPEPIVTAPVSPSAPVVTAAPVAPLAPAVTGPPAARRVEPAPREKQKDPLELGVALAGGPGLGLGAPAAGRGLAGGGGELRVALRLRNGVSLGAGFRGHTRLEQSLALGRFRGALVVGHVLRRGGFELAALAGPTIETWQITQRGAPVTYTTSSSSGAALLFGGLVRLSPGARVQRPRLSLRIGGYVELAGSARSSGRAAQIGVRDGEVVRPVFVLGGAELSIGVEVELWVRLLRRAQR